MPVGWREGRGEGGGGSLFREKFNEIWVLSDVEDKGVK
jgi:hypothetical protein